MVQAVASSQGHAEEQRRLPRRRVSNQQFASAAQRQSLYCCQNRDREQLMADLVWWLTGTAAGQAVLNRAKDAVTHKFHEHKPSRVGDPDEEEEQCTQGVHVFMTTRGNVSKERRRLMVDKRTPLGELRGRFGREMRQSVIADDYGFVFQEDDLKRPVFHFSNDCALHLHFLDEGGLMGGAADQSFALAKSAQATVSSATTSVGNATASALRAVSIPVEVPSAWVTPWRRSSTEVRAEAGDATASSTLHAEPKESARV